MLVHGLNIYWSRKPPSEENTPYGKFKYLHTQCELPLSFHLSLTLSHRPSYNYSNICQQNVNFRWLFSPDLRYLGVGLLPGVPQAGLPRPAPPLRLPGVRGVEPCAGGVAVVAREEGAALVAPGWKRKELFKKQEQTLFNDLWQGPCKWNNWNKK